jgi:VanZ family protein
MPTLAGRAAAVPAALAMAALVLYASLYPFAGWRWPPGVGAADLLRLPWPIYRLPFDIGANFAGYLPLGWVLAWALRRSSADTWRPVIGATLLAAALSYAVEVAQHFLPGRHPSLMDWALNAGGAAVGALLFPWTRRFGWLRAGGDWMSRRSEPGGAGAATLLALWPLALLFPAPVALGLGHVGPRLQPLLADALDGVPWAQPWHAALTAVPTGPPAPLGAPLESLITALGLLAPCLVAYAVVRPGWRRVALALGATALTVGVMTLSTALNFGPQHALAWLAPATLPGLAAGLAAALALAPLPRRLAAGLGLVVLTGLVLLVARAPADPYFAYSLQRWEQGRFIRFHGLAQWVGWLWPYAALLWLLGRVGAAPTIPR